MMMMIHWTSQATMASASPLLPSPAPPQAKPKRSSPTRVSLYRRSPLPQLPSTPSKGLPENLRLVVLTGKGRHSEALDLVRRMEASGLRIRPHFYERLFDACAASRSLDLGLFFHDRIKRDLGRGPDGPIGASLVAMYCECSAHARALQVFDEMPHRSPGAWRAMTIGFARGGLLTEAVEFISGMLSLGFEVDPLLAVALVRGAVNHHGRALAGQVHSLIVRLGLSGEFTIDTTLANMYAKLRCPENSRAILKRMEETSIVAWTGLMTDHIERGEPENALRLFSEMASVGVEMDPFVFSTVFKACCKLADLALGRQVHGLVLKLGMAGDVFVGTSLVDFYGTCGLMLNAKHAFDKILLPNEYSWSSLISGYAQAGELDECIETFRNMRSREDIVLNEHDYTSIFRLCAMLSDSSSGRQLHADAIKRCFVAKLYGESALVTMYAKSGDLDSACRAFDLIENPDVVSWSAIISGCAYHAEAPKALHYFSKMQANYVRPNSKTLTGVLTACSHYGLIDHAKAFFDSMEQVFGVKPVTPHFNCMVYMYCRTNRLDEAFSLTKGDLFKPDAVTWKTLLSGCVKHSNVELGQIAGEHLLELEPDDASGYVLLFNLYASSGKLEEASNVRRLMNERSIFKELGCSWMTVKGEVHRFVVGDRHHPRTGEIYAKLAKLGQESALEHGSSTDGDDVLDERKNQLLDHSEKLAVVFGLLSIPRGSPMTIFNNVRICKDCHSFCKWVSKTTKCEIIIRDLSRFHRFRDGVCSCRDYW